MAAIDPSTIVPNLVIGPFVVLGGVLILVYRRGLHAFTARSLKALYGGTGAWTSQRSSPFWVGAVGIGAIAIGVVQIGGAITGLIQLSS